jgi:hypothetical protein
MRICSIPSILKEGRREGLPSGLANSHDTHPSYACHIPGGAKQQQQEEEEGSDDDVPTTVANSQDNHPSHAHNFPSVAEEEEKSNKDLPSSGASGQDRTCLCSMQSIHEEEECDEE